jgi:hypothetical protein
MCCRKRLSLSRWAWASRVISPSSPMDLSSPPPPPLAASGPSMRFCRPDNQPQKACRCPHFPTLPHVAHQVLGLCEQLSMRSTLSCAPHIPAPKPIHDFEVRSTLKSIQGARFVFEHVKDCPCHRRAGSLLRCFLRRRCS